METTNQVDLDFAAIDTITERFKFLLQQNWLPLRMLAEQPEAGGRIGASFSLGLNFTGKTPCGSLKVGYGPKRKSDSTEFFVEDPKQGKLPINEPAGSVVGVEFGPGNSQGDPVREVADRVNRFAEALPEGTQVEISSGGKKLATIKSRRGGAK